jgi:NhaP-type Na+/H+ or K+/H+ antiporter
MVNDAVAIILFKVVGGIFDKIQEEGMTFSETMSEIIGSFLTTVIYSVLIGVGSGKMYDIQLFFVPLCLGNFDSL